MAQSDVTVKLSAEGLSQVVAAFQKIASEGKKSGHEASESFKELNNQLKDVAKTLTGGIGIVLVAEKFREFFKSTLEGSENLTRLSKQTGLSTDLIQGFGRAARETGIDQETANNALQKFTVQVGKAGVGSKASRDALSDLGISIKDFTKLSPDQQFQKVATSIAAIADPARRARDEVGLFSKAGVQLDQALVSVGKNGLNPFIEHMKELGIFLDQDTIASLKRANESFRDLGDTVKGMATQFLTGLVPGLQAAADSLLAATTGPGVSGIKKLGELIGEVFRAVVNALEHTGNNIAAIAVKTQLFFADLKNQAKGIFDKELAAKSAREYNAAINAVNEENKRRNEAADIRADSNFDEVHTSRQKIDEGGAGAEGANAAALARAKLALLEASLDNQLKLYQANAALVKEADQKAYNDGTISLAEYFARRATLITAQADKELATLRAKRSALAASPIDQNDEVGEINRRKELQKLDNEIAVEEIKRTGELAKNTDEQATAQRKLYTDTLKAEESLLIIAGKKNEAARLKLALDIADQDERLRKAGVSDADRGTADAQFAQQGNAKIDFNEQSQQAQAALAALESKRKEIENQVRDGQIFSIDGAQKIVALDKERLPALQAQADAMLKLAQAENGPDGALDVAKAQAFKDKLDAIAVSTDKAGQAASALRSGLENAVGGGLTTFLNDAVSGTKTLRQAFADMALSIIADIEKIIIKQLVLKALETVFSASGGGGVGSAAAPAGHAGGGAIRGPGTSTSDSIPAFLSDGEFVINAKSVKQPGVLPLLNALNDGGLKGVHGPTGIPKYASGGQVSGAALTTHKIVNVLDPSLLGDHLATEPGERAVLNIIGRNPNKVRSSL